MLPRLLEEKGHQLCYPDVTPMNYKTRQGVFIGDSGTMAIGIAHYSLTGFGTCSTRMDPCLLLLTDQKPKDGGNHRPQGETEHCCLSNWHTVKLPAESL